MEELIKRIGTILEVLGNERYSNSFQVDKLKIKSVGYGQRAVMLEDPSDWDDFLCNGHWGGKDMHCCFKTVIQIPEEFTGKEVIVSLRTGATDIWNTDNPQFLVYIDGKMTCAMDVNHQEVCLTKCAITGHEHEFGLYAYTNSTAPSITLQLQVSLIHREVEKLYYDIKVPFEAAVLQKEENLQRLKCIPLLARTINLLDLRKRGSTEFYNSVLAANRYLQENYYDTLCGLQEVTVHSIGHTHIDVAWKWPLRQTREKVLRSFQTVLYLMEEYPEYKFMSSQPQLYEFVKEDCPKMYEQIKERIKEGRWEVEGAMWLEADCNLTSGESLIRQILHGNRFFNEEFDVEDSQILWLPDVFGYSAALPQILQKSGVKYFMTTKIAWNEYNQIPNDVMMWKGIDGTEILTYFITTTNYNPYPELTRKPNISTTYNGRQNASQIMGTWQRFQNKELLTDVLTCYGYGDGGGGTTTMMLEENKRLEKGIPGCPQTRQTFAADFFQLIEQELQGKVIPKWSGELYLEFHRGTYTSMARNKRYNRLCEFKNSDAELFCIMDRVINGTKSYPAKELDKAWKLTLLNQFHDILPGSSIWEVYEDSKVQYEEVLQLDEDLIDKAQKAIMKSVMGSSVNVGQGLIIWNQLSLERDSIVILPKEQFSAGSEGYEIRICIDNEVIPVQFTHDGKLICKVKKLPSKGYRAVNICKTKNPHEDVQEDNNGDIQVAGRTIKTPYYIVQFNEAGGISSIYDRSVNRELVLQGQIANQLVVFEDRPREYDAWNIDSTYTERFWMISDLVRFEATENGPVRTCLHLEWKFMDSMILQDILLYPDSRRIDFTTTVDWHEAQLLLKTAFPMDIQTNKATYDIQFGNVERPTHKNTSWEQAKFEVCAHKWADISEDGYGVALLNDCKYGYDIAESTMRLTLIKSGIFPNPIADQEVHQFTYSLLPHLGDFRDGRVIQEALDLNCPVYSRLLLEEKCPAAEFTWSMLSLDCENVIADVIKKAEDNEDIILRFFETFGRRSIVTVTMPELLQNSSISECNLMEQGIEQGNLESKDGKVSFLMKPYEIKTFRIHTV